jgi:hypothetical protein
MEGEGEGVFETNREDDGYRLGLVGRAEDTHVADERVGLVDRFWKGNLGVGRTRLSEADRMKIEEKAGRTELLESDVLSSAELDEVLRGRVKR